MKHCSCSVSSTQVNSFRASAGISARQCIVLCRHTLRCTSKIISDSHTRMLLSSQKNSRGKFPSLLPPNTMFAMKTLCFGTNHICPVKSNASFVKQNVLVSFYFPTCSNCLFMWERRKDVRQSHTLILLLENQ